MVEYTIADIAHIIGGTALLPNPDSAIANLLTDSRRLASPSSTLFVALQSNRRNGEDFVAEMYAAGVRSFVVSPGFDNTPFAGANVVLVNDTLHALQQLAAYHRSCFQLPVIGITGSNGKTIVKEWLYQLLHQQFNIVRSPKSYNSQIGVPLSVWGINSQHTLAIFEAGISEQNEMQHLADIIQPTIGILTNIGPAHAAGFENDQQKLLEKWQLFRTADTIVCSNSNPLVADAIKSFQRSRLFIWGNGDADLQITRIDRKTDYTHITALYQQREISITIPFTDNAAIENAMHCWCVMLLLKADETIIARGMQQLQPVEMRLQLKKGINHCAIINDSYSNDLSSLRIALDFLQQQAGNQPRTVILSDLGESTDGLAAYTEILHALKDHGVHRFIGIGPMLGNVNEQFRKAFPVSAFFPSTGQFVQQFSASQFKEEVILIKGARAFQFERINRLFEQKVHQTVLDVNLSAMIHNLKEYQHHLQPTTRVMAMVKAFSYGSGSAEVARKLQFHNTDYLAVAYADEGVELRKAAIHLPIMVMNPETVTLPALVEYHLEPELYSFSILQQFNDHLEREGIDTFPVHIKIDTGMHRLGFEAADIHQLAQYLSTHPRLKVASVFSHLAGSESALFDQFTHQQVKDFAHACDQLQQAIGYAFLRHIANSAAIFRHPHYQFDMVRLGIGLYGVDSIGESALNLQTVATLRSTIAQIRMVKAGESVGYNRRGKVETDSLIATVRIGYADGFSRRMGNGVGAMWVHGQQAPVVGSVCMDMTMINVSHIPGVKEGDTVEIFGPHLPVQQIAQWCETIPYEILTGISQRVKREYFEE